MRPLILATASLAALLAGACSSRVERFDYPLAYAEDSPNPNRLGIYRPALRHHAERHPQRERLEDR
jgi:hypothetical protein